MLVVLSGECVKLSRDGGGSIGGGVSMRRSLIGTTAPSLWVGTF